MTIARVLTTRRPATRDKRRTVYRLGAGIRTADAAHSAAFCVTGSVAVETPRNGQDATGRNSIIEPYLAPRADFTKEFANSMKRSIRFSRPRMTLVRKTSAFRSLRHRLHPKSRPLPELVNVQICGLAGRTSSASQQTLRDLWGVVRRSSGTHFNGATICHGARRGPLAIGVSGEDQGGRCRYRAADGPK
jgi:hypothetical protein